MLDAYQLPKLQHDARCTRVLLGALLALRSSSAHAVLTAGCTLRNNRGAGASIWHACCVGRAPCAASRLLRPGPQREGPRGERVVSRLAPVLGCAQRTEYQRYLAAARCLHCSAGPRIACSACQGCTRCEAGQSHAAAGALSTLQARRWAAQHAEQSEPSCCQPAGHIHAGGELTLAGQVRVGVAQLWQPGPGRGAQQAGRLVHGHQHACRPASTHLRGLRMMPLAEASCNARDKDTQVAAQRSTAYRRQAGVSSAVHMPWAPCMQHLRWGGHAPPGSQGRLGGPGCCRPLRPAPPASRPWCSMPR